MKARIKHIYDIIAGAILSLLGFNGCGDIIFPVEYGMPYATFAVKGTVKAEDTGNPVEGIKVKFRQHVEGTVDEHGNPQYREIEFYSDKDGKAETRFTEWPVVKDIEITFNISGSYKTLTCIREFYKHSPACNTGYNAFIHFTNSGFHVLSLFKLVSLSLSLFSSALCFR